VISSTSSSDSEHSVWMMPKTCPAARNTPAAERTCSNDFAAPRMALWRSGSPSRLNATTENLPAWRSNRDAHAGRTARSGALDDRAATAGRRRPQLRDPWPPLRQPALPRADQGGRAILLPLRHIVGRDQRSGVSSAMMKIYVMLSYIGWAWTLVLLIALGIALKLKGRNISRE